MPKASCESCREITGEFEQDVLRGPMWPVRIISKLQSRTNHQEASEKEPLIVVKGGQEQVVELSLEEFPILMPFPLFPPPANLTDTKYTNGIQLTGQVTISFGANPEYVLKKLGATQIRITPKKLFPVSFARMLAKIAYSYAFAEGALNSLEGESSILPSLLGKRDEIGLWVGILDSSLIARTELLHRIALIEDRVNNLLLVEIQLFSNSPTPRYHVILGKLR